MAEKIFRKHKNGLTRAKKNQPDRTDATPPAATVADPPAPVMEKPQPLASPEPSTSTPMTPNPVGSEPCQPTFPGLVPTTALFLIFSAFIFLLYSPSLNGDFVFDDWLNIGYPEGMHLKELSLAELRNVFTQSKLPNRAVANLTFALNYYFHGLKPLGYHLVNVFIHCLNAFLLFILVRRTLDLSGYPGSARRIFRLSFITAAIWAVHPLQTQSVSYLVQRMNSLAAMFYLISIITYLKGRSDNRRIYFYFIISALAFICAVLSKENAATLPLIILLYEWFFLQDLSRRFLRSKAVAWSAVAALMVLILIVFESSIIDGIISGYRLRNFTMGQRILTEFNVIFFYLGQFILPHPSRLSLEHNFPLSYSLFKPLTTLFSALGLAGIFALVVYRARQERLLAFCVLWFLINMVIESSFIGLILVFEHRMFLPSMFLVLLVVLLADRLITKKLPMAIATSVVVTVLSFWTYQRNMVWSDSLLVYRDTVQKAPDTYLARYHLAKTLQNRHLPDEAIPQYFATLRLNPGEYFAHNNLGVIYQEKGEYDKAIYHYKTALAICPTCQQAQENLRNLQ
jgi:tetratricopeptide (TPR) repeat protein